MSTTGTPVVDSAEVWTIESAHLMTEVTGGTGVDLFTLQKDSLQDSWAWSHSFTDLTTLDGVLTDTKWCSFFERYTPLFIDRTVDLTLNDAIASTYPDLIIDRFVN